MTRSARRPAVLVRLEPDDYDRIEVAARSLGVSKAVMMRTLALERAGRADHGLIVTFDDNDQLERVRRCAERVGLDPAAYLRTIALSDVSALEASCVRVPIMDDEWPRLERAAEVRRTTVSGYLRAQAACDLGRMIYPVRAGTDGHRVEEEG